MFIDNLEHNNRWCKIIDD